MRPRRRFAIFLPFALCFLALGSGSVRGQADAPADESRDKQIMERFKTVLDRTPRRGTALDRVYGYHVERGTLDALIKSYRDRLAKDPADGSAWLLIGLLESQRGKDAEAVLAFREAEKARPNDALPSYYLGQALVLVGQPDNAAEAFERALARKPIRADLLEIFQALGRVHQRAHRPDKALEVWSRLEKLFPDDLRVQEQIAAALAEEEQPEQALERYLKLSDKVTDSYRKIQFKLESAAIRVRIGKSKEALADFEALLGKLDPDSWIARDVRRKIEEVFLRRDDLAGLAAYYESWIAKTPDDIEAMTRLGRTLAQMSRAEDARKWYDKAVKLAPRRKDLRLALIDLLRKQADFASADKQYEELNKNDPGDPDVIRDWGRMRISDTTKTEAERKKAAAEVWRKLVKEDSKDPVPAAQAAELFRQAGLEEDAIAYFKKAIDLAPESSQYREYLGEYYHALKRPAEALAVWRETVQGKAHTAKNLGRLGEVMAGFGYRKEALEPLTEAVKLEPDDLDLSLKRADILLALEQPKDAEAELDRSEKLAADEEQTEAVLMRRIKALQASKSLGAKIIELRDAIQAAAKPKAADWSRLARYLEADGRPVDATVAAAKAVEADPKSVPAWKVLARLREATGEILPAADAYRTLVNLDRRARTDYLTNIAKLESKLGRREQALKAGRDLIAAAPGNPEHDQFFSELCFTLGEVDEGLESLRRSVRANPSDPKIMITLAENLAKQFRAEEAIELYWRAFEKTTDLEGKLGIIAKMTEQYLQRGQFERLLLRIERELREQDQQREKSLCLASAHQAAGDFASARQELEKLLGVYPKDLVLLRQLSSIAENASDNITAAQFQSRINELAPSEEGDSRLATLYLKAGDIDKASEIWGKSADGDKDLSRILTSIDSLMSTGKTELAARVLESRLRRDPRNWELLTRQAILLIDQGKRGESLAVFRTLLDLTLDDDTPSSSSAKVNARGAAGTRSLSTYDYYPPVLYRMSTSYYARAIAGLDQMNRMGTSVGAGWNPKDYGQVRLAAIAAVWAAAGKGYETSLKKRFDDNPNDARAAWDLAYLAQVNNDTKLSELASRRLAKAAPSDLGAQFVFVQAMLPRLQRATGARSYYNYRDPSADQSPVTKDELDALHHAARALARSGKGWYIEGYVGGVITELNRAKREAEALELTRDLVAGAQRYQSLTSLAMILATAGDADGLKKLEERYDAIKSTIPPSAINIYNNPESTITTRRMGVLAEKKDPALILQVWDEFRTRRRRSRKEEARRAAMAPQRASVLNRNTYVVQTYVSSKQLRSVTIDFNLNLDSFGLAETQALRTAFEIAKDGGWVDRLVKHLESGAGAKSDEDRVDDQIALVMVHWWQDDKDQAIVSLRKATEIMPTSSDLALALGDLYSRRGEFAEALAAVDKVDVVDQKVMQKKETAALRLAVRIGDAARARKAAERLFGLRLDANTQIELASLMSRLGMFDMADAVLNRAQRDAGSRVGSLISLMYQFVNQGKTEQAVEAAYQVLRQSPPPNSAATGVGGAGMGQAIALNLAMTQQGMNPAGDSSENNRRQALSVLARAGRLREMIARAEAQRDAAPNSPAILKTLIEYYTADNKPDLVRKTQDQLIKLQPDNTRSRLQAAIQALSATNAEATIGKVKEIVSAEPRLMVEFYNPLTIALRGIGKESAFAELIESLDLKKMGQSYPAVRAAQILSPNPDTRKRAMALYGRMLDAFPAERFNLLAQLLNDDLGGEIPNLYDTLKGEILKQAGQSSQTWYATELILSSNGNGKVRGYASALLDAAGRDGKEKDLEKALVDALAASPDWSAGRLMLAVLHARLGRADEAKKETAALVGDSKKFMPMISRGWLSDELESNNLEGLAKELNDRMTRDLIATLDSDRFDLNTYTQTASGLASRNRKAEAVELYVKLAQTKPIDLQDPLNTMLSYVQSISLNAGRQLQSLGATAEAMAAYERGRRYALEAKLTPDQEVNRASLLTQIQQSIEMLYRAAKPEDREKCLAMILGVTDDEKAPPAVDLRVEPLSSPLEIAQLQSKLAQWFQASLMKEDRPLARKILAETAAKGRAGSRAIVALALLDELEVNVEAIAKDAEAAKTWASAHPLSALDSKDNAALMDQVALWFPAKLALTQPKLRETGKFLADRALAAALRLPKPVHAQAILREWGDLASKAGDKAQAEQLWSQLLQSVIADPKKPAPGVGFKTRRPQVVPVSARVLKSPRQVVGKPAARAEPAEPKARTTRLKFDQSLAVAKLAASRGMKDLSFRAVREAFASGPPIDPSGDDLGDPFGGAQVNQFATTTLNLRFTRAGTAGDAATTQSPQIAPKLIELESLWSSQGATPAEIYGLLRDIVIPPNRPSEVHLFADGSPTGGGVPLGIGGTLVTVARNAKQLDDLVKRLNERTSKPGAELNALAILAEVARAGNDPKATNDLLQRFNDRLKANTLQNTIDLAIRVAGPALEVDATSEQAAIVLETCLKSIQKAPSGSSLSDIGLQLARHDYRKNRPDAAKARIEAYLEAQDRIQRRSGQAANVATRRANIEAVAYELLKINRPFEALDLLGRSADLPEIGSTAIQPNLIALLARRLALLPAEERFEKLRAWTMPTKNRLSVRLLGSVVNEIPFPSEFDPVARKEGVSPKLPTGAAPGVLSLQWLLVDAAKQTGKLDQLAAEVKKAADERVENAEIPNLLIEAVQGRFEKAGAVLAEIEKAESGNGINGTYNYSTMQYQWAGNVGNANRLALKHVEIAALALNSPAAGSDAEKFLGRWAATLPADTAPHPIRRLLRNREIARSAPRWKGEDGLRPDAWRSFPLDNPASSWLVHEGVLKRTQGLAGKSLLFDFPLAGRFELEGEVRLAPGSAGLISYAGAASITQEVSMLPRQGEFRSPTPVSRESWFTKENFNHVRMIAQDSTVQLYINGIRVSETPRLLGDPWLRLTARGATPAEFRRLSIKGTPTIPKSVDLLGDPSLRSWSFGGSAAERVSGGPTAVASVTGQSVTVTGSMLQPAMGLTTLGGRPVTVNTTIAVPAISVRSTSSMAGAPVPPPAATIATTRNGWTVAGVSLSDAKNRGVTTGRPSPASAVWTNGLKPGDVFTYEFFHDEGNVGVEPQVGPAAFLLRSDGVKLQLVDQAATSALALPEGVTVPCPFASKPPVLKNKAWNTASISVNDGMVVIYVNGQEVVNGKFDVGPFPAVGFHHDRNKTAVQVRGVRLQGAWPDRLPSELAANLLATKAEPTDAQAALGDRTIEEEIRADDLEFLERSTKSLAAKARYEALAKFVLPNASHDSLRLNSMIKADGTVIAPATALVATAKELGLLDQLAARLDEIKAKQPVLIRETTALGVAVDTSRGKIEAAKKGLETLWTKAAGREAARKNAPNALPIADLHPEFTAAQAAIALPELRVPALALIDKVVEPWGKLDPVPSPLIVRLAALASDAGPAPALAWFVPTSRGDSKTRTQGYPIGGWRLKDGAFVHIPGREQDTLAFRVPLTGDFEVKAELTTGSRLKSTRLAYGGISIVPKSDKSTIVKVLNGVVTETSASLLPPNLGDTYEYRLVLQGNRLTAYVHNKMIGEHRFDVPPAPWLTLEAPPISSGSIRKLSITAKSAPPSSVGLLKSRLSGWTPDAAASQPRGDSPTWTADGNELLGSVSNVTPSPMDSQNDTMFSGTGTTMRLNLLMSRQRAMQAANREPEIASTSAMPLESYLRLNRALRDGESLEFEVYQQGPRLTAAPVFGRTAFLIDAKTVATHAITNAPSAEDGDPNARGPATPHAGLTLKPGSWVKHVVALRDGKLTITAADKTVVERKLEPGADTTVGLFHFTNESAARVRGVKLNADWPALPTADKLLEPAR